MLVTTRVYYNNQYSLPGNKLLKGSLNIFLRVKFKEPITMVRLIDRLFNSTSTQKGQFVPTVGEGNLFNRLRMANEIQCIISHVTRQQCNTICSKTLQSQKRNNRLSNWMTYSHIIKLAPSPIRSQIPHTLFDIYNFSRCGCNLTIMPRTYVRQFSLVHIAKCDSTKSWIMSSYFTMSGFRETLCASTRDNRHNWDPTTWVTYYGNPHIYIWTMLVNIMWIAKTLAN